MKKTINQTQQKDKKENYYFIKLVFYDLSLKVSINSSSSFCWSYFDNFLC